MKVALTVFGLIGLDQWSKYWARTSLENPMELWSGAMFRFTENTGVAFSLPLPMWVTITLGLVVAAFIIHQLITENLSKLKVLALVLILGGALGNLIDRIWLGAVTDFIAVYEFPIFNLADSLISIGVVVYLWEEVIGSEA